MSRNAPEAASPAARERRAPAPAREGTGAPRPHVARAAPLRVAYLVNQYPRTSVSFIRREIRALEREGATVTRFSLRPVEEELATPDDREEAERTRFVLGSGLVDTVAGVVAGAFANPTRCVRALTTALALGRGSQAGVVMHLAYLAEACLLVRWIRAAGAQHVHAHFGTNSATVALLVRELGGPPFSFTVHGPEEFDRPEALKLKDKIARAAFVVAVSQFGRSQLWRWAAFEDWPKVEVVHCGLPAELLEAAATPVPAARRLVCVARLSEQKGHMLLLDAAARLARDGSPFEVVFAGDGPLRPTLERRIRELRLERHVRVAGWMSADAVRDEILASRALVLPSFAEGLPVVVMEALALGRPVITTSVAGTPELVERGTMGWLVPAGDVDALASAMREAFETDPARLAEMGRAGAARVAAQHDAAAEARKLLRLFARALDPRGAPAPSTAGPRR